MLGCLIDRLTDELAGARLGSSTLDTLAVRQKVEPTFAERWRWMQRRRSSHKKAQTARFTLLLLEDGEYFLEVRDTSL